MSQARDRGVTSKWMKVNKSCDCGGEHSQTEGGGASQTCRGITNRWVNMSQAKGWGESRQGVGFVTIR